MKTEIRKIETMDPPPGSVHLGRNGWVVDQPERLTIRANIDLQRFAENIATSNAGLLGEGKLVFAMFDLSGSRTDQPGVTDYPGHIFFIPSED